MIKAKLLKKESEEFRSIKAEDFPSKEDNALLHTLILFRHIDDKWFNDLLKELKIKGIKPTTARKIVTSSIRKVMEAKKR